MRKVHSNKKEESTFFQKVRFLITSSYKPSMYKRYFVYGSTSRARLVFVEQYATLSDKTLCTITRMNPWEVTFRVDKVGQNDESIYLWDSLEDSTEVFMEQMHELLYDSPFHDYIISSQFPPDYYDVNIKKFFTSNNFEFIEIPEESTSDTQLEHVDTLIETLL